MFSGEFCFQAVYTEGLHTVASENKKGESNRHQLTEHGKYKRRMKKDYLWMLLNSLSRVVKGSEQMINVFVRFMGEVFISKLRRNVMNYVDKKITRVFWKTTSICT